MIGYIPEVEFEDYEFCSSDPNFVIPIPANVNIIQIMASGVNFNVTSSDIIIYPSYPLDTTSIIVNYTHTVLGCVLYDTFNIIPENNNYPNVGSNYLNACANTPRIIGSSNNDVGPSISYLWSPATYLSCTTCLTPTFTASSPGMYTYYLNKDDGSGCITHDSVIINVSEAIAPIIENVTVCENSCVQLEVLNFQNSYTYNWTPNEYLSSNSIHNPIACLEDQSMVYTVTATSSNGCTAQTSVGVTVNNSSAPVIDMLDSIQVMELPTTVQAWPTVTSSNPTSYSWSIIDGNISNPYILNPVFTIFNTPITYWLTVTDQVTGCTSTKSVTFYLTPSVLPVELTKFEVSKFEGSSLLTWATASELNNDRFEIYRSFDANSWEYLGSVSGAGTTNTYQSYEYIDNQPSKGINYYRLKQVDFDGNYEYSSIRFVEFENSNISSNKKVIWYPNPSNGTITFMNSELFDQVVISDMLGRKVLSKSKLDDNRLHFDDLIPGTYFIHFVGNQFIQTDKIIIQ